MLKPEPKPEPEQALLDSSARALRDEEAAAQALRPLDEALEPAAHLVRVRARVRLTLTLTRSSQLPTVPKTPPLSACTCFTASREYA